MNFIRIQMYTKIVICHSAITDFILINSFTPLFCLGFRHTNRFSKLVLSLSKPVYVRHSVNLEIKAVVAAPLNNSSHISFRTSDFLLYRLFPFLQTLRQSWGGVTLLRTIICKPSLSIFRSFFAFLAFRFILIWHHNGIDVKPFSGIPPFFQGYSKDFP